MIAVTQKIDEFFSKYPKRTYPKGQILLFANENPNNIFYIKKGRVRKYDISYRGDEIVVNVFQPPAFFPMSWAISHIKNNYFYKAEVDSELHIIPTQDALAFVESNPDILFDLLDRLYRGTEGILGRMLHLMSGTAKSRLIYELIIECQRFGEKNKQGFYRLDATESDLAARCGLTRETISREMHAIKNQEIIEIDSKGIVVKNLDTLKKQLSSAF